MTVSNYGKPVAKDSTYQWDLYDKRPRERRKNVVSAYVTIYGEAPSGAPEEAACWIIWRETLDVYGRNMLEYAQGGNNCLRWTYNELAFDPIPNPNGTPYDIQLDNQTVIDGMVAGLPVANITASDVDDVVHTFELITDLSNKFSIVGSVLFTDDTVDLVDVAYIIRIRATDDEGNSFTKWFTITIVPVVPVTDSPRGLVTLVAADDTGWTLLPATPLEGRVALTVQNFTGFDVEVKHSDSGAYGTGILMIDGDERSYEDFSPLHTLYVRFAPGESGTLRVEEMTR